VSCNFGFFPDAGHTPEPEQPEWNADSGAIDAGLSADSGADAGPMHPPKPCPSGSPLCASCSGYVAKTCSNGTTMDVCCPEGTACNFGMGVVFCGDGTCGFDSYVCEGDGEIDAGS